VSEGEVVCCRDSDDAGTEDYGWRHFDHRNLRFCKNMEKIGRIKMADKEMLFAGMRYPALAPHPLLDRSDVVNADAHGPQPEDLQVRRLSSDE
jgi:hypothetical protein